MHPELILSVFTTPWGLLKVQHDGHFVFTAQFTDEPGILSDTPLDRLIAKELSAYRMNAQHPIKVPLKAQGSTYQQQVWTALLAIPVGETLSYGELALDLKSAPRAIGQACKRNPIALFIPCHRVVGKDNLGGYMGSTEALSYKTALLKHERTTTSAPPKLGS